MGKVHKWIIHIQHTSLIRIRRQAQKSLELEKNWLCLWHMKLPGICLKEVEIETPVAKAKARLYPKSWG